jgi:hypothetical protein
VTVFIHFIYAPSSIVFPYPFIFRTPYENNESTFHCIKMDLKRHTMDLTDMAQDRDL